MVFCAYCIENCLNGFDGLVVTYCVKVVKMVFKWLVGGVICSRSDRNIYSYLYDNIAQV